MSDNQEVIINTLLTDVSYVLEDYLDRPDRCFMVAVTLYQVLHDLNFDTCVHAVRLAAHGLKDTTLGKVWDTRSNKRPRHVILRVGDRFVDVTSRQVDDGFPWTMEVAVDGSAKVINDIQVRYHDLGEYFPSNTQYKRCFDIQLYGIGRALILAALRRTG
jgi:hypothetical protein